jgi:hypothetical protein
MPETQMKIIVDLSKPKGQRETYVPLTEEEIAQLDSDRAGAEAKRAEQQAIDDQTAIDAKAGRDALVALGLTEEQITALVGA